MCFSPPGTHGSIRCRATDCVWGGGATGGSPLDTPHSQVNDAPIFLWERGPCVAVDCELIIGFEIHTELKTRTKIFCGCSTEFGSSPNT